jgi:hypothetical protein
MFALVCFAPEGGSGLTDTEVYEQRKLGGGLGYTDSQLQVIFSQVFEILSLRKMKDVPSETNLFGQGFLWTMLMKSLPNKALQRTRTSRAAEL